MISPSLRDPSAVTVPPANYGHDPAVDVHGSRRMFKKHKVLPRPDRDRAHAVSSFAYDAWPERAGDGLVNEIPRPRNGDSRTPRRSQPTHNGPALPPTPPAPSQNSSGSLTALPSSSLWAVSPLDSEGGAPSSSPVTPPNEKSPPTPDETPPQRIARPKAVRTLLGDQTPSKSASDSRSESYKTAREDNYTSEDESGKNYTHTPFISARTSQSTVRHAGKDDGASIAEKQSNGQAHARETADPVTTPRSKIRPVTFDGEWRMNTGGTEVVQEWDDNLQRHVKVRKSRPYPDPKTPSPADRFGTETCEDAVVTPTNATKAVQAMHVNAHNETRASPNGASPKKERAVSSPAASPATTDVRRLSGISAKSGVSTVVEAMLVDTVVPQRKRTLRHVKKQMTLRSSNTDVASDSSGLASSSTLQEPSLRRSPPRRPVDGRYNNRASVASINSISSARTREEVWNQGAIPVVIVPGRQFSKKPGEPILRSTSSRRSRRSASLTSAPLSNGSTSREMLSASERRSRHGRSVSEANGADVRTIDYPPLVPKRASSLSGPTSQNGSRTGSLTTESLKAHNDLLEAETLKRALSKVDPEKPEEGDDDTRREWRRTLQPPEVTMQPAASTEGEEGSQRLSLGDPLCIKRMSSQNTPFSLASMDTCGTAPEVSEALAVSIYAHQNTSILMVDHGSSKPSQDSEVDISKDARASEVQSPTGQPQPTITTTAPESDEPATPPQQQLPEVDVDYSPLRNPRSPPEPPAGPPAITFIPATPSGATPAHERENLMGNYFEEMEPKPRQSMSFVRRVLPRRRHSESASSARRPSFLSRTLSLSRGVRKVAGPFASERGSDRALRDDSPPADDAPADEHMLHPFWRPAYSDYESDTDSTEEEEFYGDGQYERVYRYPPIDNRPRRNFSQRLKRTFAVFPLDNEPRFYDGPPGTERRTIERTPSGNLRVVRRRSLDDDAEPLDQVVRPYTAPDSPDPAPSFWRGYKRGNAARRTGEEKRGFLPSLGSRLGALPRRLSERRRERRTEELRGMISGPREVRDGVGDVTRRGQK